MTSNSGCYTYTVSRMVYSLGLRGFRGSITSGCLYCIDLERVYSRVSGVIRRFNNFRVLYCISRIGL